MSQSGEDIGQAAKIWVNPMFEDNAYIALLRRAR